MSVIAKLCLAAALTFCPKVVETEPFPNEAMIIPWFGTIYVSKGLTKNNDELAFVLAHELGHLVLRYEPHPEEEIDAYAIRLIVPLGYDCNRGIEVLRRFDVARWRKARERCNG